MQLTAVRVLDCSGSGTYAGVISGIDWVTQHAVKPAVANMSLGGGASTSVDSAVRNSITSGVMYAVAGGNSSTNACTTSPARTAEAITVGATTNTDAGASYSNCRSCLDIFAPGSSIKSGWIGSDGHEHDQRHVDGDAHVTGAAALYLAPSHLGLAGDGAQCPGGRRHHRQGDQRGFGIPERAALHRSLARVERLTGLRRRSLRSRHPHECPRS